MTSVPSEAERLCTLAYERYSAGDFDGQLELFDEEVEVYVAPPNFESGTYHGHAEYRGLIERWGAAWDKMRIEVQDLEAEGEWIIALVHYIGCGEGLGGRDHAAVVGAVALARTAAAAATSSTGTRRRAGAPSRTARRSASPEPPRQADRARRGWGVEVAA